jgi:serpin B
MDAFSVDLYKILAREPGNLVMSPYSVGVALAMTRTGAVGETSKQMDAVLHAALAKDIHAGFNALEQTLAKRPGKYKVGDQTLELELATANRLWGQKDFTFERAFLDTLAKQYGAGMQIVDYKTAYEAARRTINDWVAARTRDRIKDLIAEGVLGADTRLVLTNAIYLKASWQFLFNDAVPAAFHRADGSEVQAELMSQSETLAYGAGDGYQAVRLPYAGGLSMVVIVPDAGKLASFERGLDGATLRRITTGLSAAQVSLSMPKFTFRSKAQLKDALGELGMPIAFTDRADFSGMTKQEPLEIADVIHQAFIAVDEKGTEAAAATAVVMRLTSAPERVVQLTIDRPFLFLIQDDETGATLFMGRLADPKA